MKCTLFFLFVSLVTVLDAFVILPTAPSAVSTTALALRPSQGAELKAYECQLLLQDSKEHMRRSAPRVVRTRRRPPSPRAPLAWCRRLMQRHPNGAATPPSA